MAPCHCCKRRDATHEVKKLAYGCKPQKPPVSDLQAAAWLCADVYDDHVRKEVPRCLPDGWTEVETLDQSAECALKARVYEETTTKRRVLIIRGTVSRREWTMNATIVAGSLQNDLRKKPKTRLAMSLLTGAVVYGASPAVSALTAGAYAMEALYRVSNFAGSRFKSTFRALEDFARAHCDEYSFVAGHSLGGFISQVFAVQLNAPGYAFNAPPLRTFIPYHFYDDVSAVTGKNKKASKADWLSKVNEYDKVFRRHMVSDDPVHKIFEHTEKSWHLNNDSLGLTLTHTALAKKSSSSSTSSEEKTKHDPHSARLMAWRLERSACSGSSGLKVADGDPGQGMEAESVRKRLEKADKKLRIQVMRCPDCADTDDAVAVMEAVVVRGYCDECDDTRSVVTLETQDDLEAYLAHASEPDV